MPMCCRPVEAFWAMVRDEESDRLVEAFAQMEAVSRRPRLRLPLGEGEGLGRLEVATLGTPPATLGTPRLQPWAPRLQPYKHMRPGADLAAGDGALA